jgi:hypothetical protein
LYNELNNAECCRYIVQKARRRVCPAELPLRFTGRFCFFVERSLKMLAVNNGVQV